MADLIVFGGTVIPMDPARRIIEDGAVAIAGDRVVAVGSTAEVLAAHPAPRKIDAARKLVLPGLIDVHAHAGHGLIKSMGANRPGAWEELCGEVYTTASTPAFWRAEAELAALERLRFGVTTGVSLLGGGDTVMRSDDPAHAAAHCEGVLAVGIRAVLAIGPTRPPHPRLYADWNGDERYDKQIDFETQLATSARVVADWHGSHEGRIAIALLTPVLRDEHVGELGPALLGEAMEQTRRVRRLSRDTGTVFTQDGHWRGSVVRAQEMGILGPDALLSHAIDLSETEIALCAETDTRIAHNPSAIASVMGRCPVTELMAAGVTVALGSDATAPDRSADMFRHMQQCMHYHRTHFRDPDILPPGQVLAMATIDAARALGMESEIGSLEPGKKADLILLDLARPHLYPLNMPAYRAVCFANGNDVHSVVVNGEVVLENRRAAKVDETAVLEAAQLECERMIARTGAHDLLGMPADFFGARQSLQDS
ncbi:amidohydrolase family protein [Pelagibius litoralis]|uniref:Amidohydrolase family protein n=1 Tax=Pelagibius litoralis TaxID=374515 RepID=A0A967C5K5_9PROT|nr:amidohydrolase family protein [Pelagibius litoralis]NIA67841.1 amidohydrolase family protein [Pelagibius litoralis]